MISSEYNYIRRRVGEEGEYISCMLIFGTWVGGINWLIGWLARRVSRRSPTDLFFENHKLIS